MRRSRSTDFRSIILGCILILTTPLIGGYDLAEMIELIDSQNSDLSTMRLSIEESEYRTFSSRAARFPTIEGEILSTYITNPIAPVYVYPDEILAGIDWPAGMEPSSSGGPVELYGGQEPTYYQFNLSITQPVFTWGKITDSIEISDRDVEVKWLELYIERDQLETTLEILLDTLWYLQRIEEIVNQQLIQVSRLVEISQQNFDNGFILKDEVLSAEIRLHEVQLAHDSLSVDISKICNEIGNLIGIYDLSVEQIDHKPDTARMLSREVQEYLDTSSETLISQQRSIELIDTYISISKLAERIKKNTIYWKPDLALRFDLGYAGPRLPLIERDWYRQDDISLNATIAIKTTIWDGGSQLIDQALSTIGVEQAIATRSSAVNQIIHTFRQTVSQYQYAQYAIDYATKKIEVNEETISFKEQQFKNGIGMETDLILAKLDLYVSRLELYQSYIDLSTQYHTIQALLFASAN